MISDILEIWSQALRLATLSALPVPMLRQVYLQGFIGLKTVFSLGTSSKNDLLASSWDQLGYLRATRGDLVAILGYLGFILGHLGLILGHLGGYVGVRR